MEVGIGLPNAVPDTTGDQLVEWARRADRAGFSSLGTIDRIVYPNYEPLVSLAAAAAVTERIRLATTILLAPTRQSAAFLAKQAASVNALAGGRLVLGIAPGGREDDFEAAGVPFDGGRLFDEMLDGLDQAWDGDRIGPDAKPKVVLGGSVDAAYRRAAEHGDGWIMGGGTPEMLAEGKQKTDAAWKDAGREGSPRIMALAYYSLGPDAEDSANRYLNHYYAFLGDYAGQIAASAAKDADTVRGYMQAFEQAGCDELILFPTSPETEQVDLLAEAAL